MRIMAAKARPNGGHGPLTHFSMRLTNLSQCEFHSDALPAASLLLATSKIQSTYMNVMCWFQNKTWFWLGGTRVVGGAGGGGSQGAGAGARLGAWESYLLPKQPKDHPPGKQRTVPLAKQRTVPQAS